MYNQFFMNLGKCGQLSGHGDTFNHREIGTTLANDRDGHQRQIIFDKNTDMVPETVVSAIGKIYESFFGKTNSDFWNERINAFEYHHQIDWYFILSYLYMINEEARDSQVRAYRTVSDACAILTKLDLDAISKDSGYINYIAQVQKQTKKDVM